MSKSMIQKKFINYSIVVCVLILFMLFAVQVTQAQTISITAPDTNAGVGNFVYIPVNIDTISGLTNWDVVITYNPGELTFYGADIAATLSENYTLVAPKFTGNYPGDLFDAGLGGAIVSGAGQAQPSGAGGVLFYAVFMTQNGAGNTSTVSAQEVPQGVGDPLPVPVDTNNPSVDITLVTQPVLPEINFSASSYTVGEGAGTATITINLSTPFYQDVMVYYSTYSNTATSNVDYTETSGTLTFAPYETTKTFTVPIIQDNKVETTESLNIGLSNNSPNAVLGATHQTVLSITNDDQTMVSFNPVNYSVNEGGTATLTLTLSNPSDVAVGVDYKTKDGTAIAPNDYTSKTGTVTFPSNVMTQTITVTTINDTRAEGNEKFSVELTTPTPATTLLGTNSTATVTIVDNDSPAIQPWSAPPGYNTPAFFPLSGSFTNQIYSPYSLMFSTSYIQRPWSLGQTTIPSYQGISQWNAFSYSTYWNYILSWNRFSNSNNPLSYYQFNWIR